MLLVVAFLFVLLTNFAHGTSDEAITINLSGYNYEIARRTQDIVNEFLDTAQPTVTQLQSLFSSGMANRYDADGLTKLLFLQIKSAPNVALIGIDFIGGISIIVTNTPYTITDSYNGTELCGPVFGPTTPTARCFTTWNLDNYGNRGAELFRYNLDSAIYTRFQTALSTGSAWTDVDNEFLLTPTLGYSVALYNSTHDIIGVSNSILNFADLDALLLSSFSNDGDGRVVFVTTEKLSLVGASIDVDTIVTVDFGGFSWIVAQKAYNSSDIRVRTAGEFMLGLSSFNHTADVMFVHKDYYIQISPVQRSNLKWFVVVIRPADASVDFISTSSSTFLGVCVVCSAMAILTLSLAMWVKRFSFMKLWSYAQPKVLLSLLAGHLIALAFGLTVVMEPSDKLCEVRAWLGTLAVTWTTATVLGKALYQHLLDSPLVAVHTRALRISLGSLGLAVLAQICLLISQSTLDLFSSNSFYTQKSGELVLNKECDASTNETNGLVLAVLQSCVIGMLCAPACYFAFLTRNASQAYAESKGLLVVVVLTVLIAVAFVVVEVFGAVTRGSVVAMLEVMAVAWYVGTTQAILFVPRVFRQLIAGDLTLNELREMIQKHSANTKQRAGVSQSHRVSGDQNAGADYTAAWR